MILKLLISVGLGFLIGLEREKSHKAVGIRTMSLITLGSTIFTIVSIYYIKADPTRIIGQIVTGIGFLGAGIIFKHAEQITGLTTAATVWCAAAVGVLVGVSLYEIAIVSTALILIINILFGHFKKEK
jgi:putative Mg2+ transporter-C (MgtC) family protein